MKINLNNDMNEKEFLIAFLGKTLNLSAEQIAPLLYKKGDDGETLTEEMAETALSEAIRMDAERVAKLKPDTKEFFNNGYKKAEAELAARHEKALRETFGIDPEGKMKGAELLTAAKAAAANRAAEPMPADQIKVHPEFLAMERNFQRQLEEREAHWQSEVEKMQTTFQREKSWTDYSGRIRQAFKSLNPVLPQEPAKAEVQTDWFINAHFKDYDFKPTDDGRLLVMKDGARVDNAHGHPMYLEDLVKQTAERFYDFAAQPPAGNAGNTNDGRQAATVRFKDENEFLDKFAKATTPEEKKTLSDAWMVQESQGKG